MAAIVAVALPLTASTAGAKTTTAADTAPAVSKCTSADLALWVAADKGQGALGTEYFPLEFTNISKSACTLNGYPGVFAITASNKQLGPAATKNSSSKATTVRLAVGATASAMLGYVDLGNIDCPAKDQSPAYELRVTAPGQTQADHAFFDLPACVQPGKATFIGLTVSVVTSALDS
jgi:hypothetical protein